MEIELADAEDTKALSVVHFADADDDGDVVDAYINGQNVSWRLFLQRVILPSKHLG